MSLFDWLGRSGRREATGTGDTETVRTIVSALEAIEPERARYLAAFAYVLGRVAHADLAVSAQETRTMEEIVGRLGHLPEAQAVLVVQIAKSQHQLFGGTENFLVTRELRAIASEAQRRDLLDCLFAVSAADGTISGPEEAQIRQIASELGFTHAEFVAARAAYSAKRSVLQPFLDPPSPADPDR